jgi:tetratricopeptide (TPR) repeat protein
MRRTLALTVVVLLAMAGDALAIGQARITGKILDTATKKPIENAVINVAAVSGKNFKEQYKVKKDGSYAIFLLDGTLQYEFTYSAPGYRDYKETMKLKLGEPNIRDIELVSGKATTTAATGPAAEIRLDPAVVAFNEGASLANEGKDVEAAAKFQEAVTARADLVAGWQALAKVNLRLKKYPQSIEAAEKAVAIDSDLPDMFAVLYEAHNAAGNKAKAAEYKSKMPANANSLFNDAARAINSGKDGDAEPLLKQAIAVDDSFAQAYYELGMLYVRGGKNADARTNLQKYLELEPSGRDAATAKEMLNYVK